MGLALLLQFVTLRAFFGIGWNQLGHWYGVQMLSALVLWAGCVCARAGLGEPRERTPGGRSAGVRLARALPGLTAQR